MVSAENGREEKIINGLEGGTTETTQSEKQRNRMIKKKKKQNRATSPCGTVTRDLRFF